MDTNNTHHDTGIVHIISDIDRHITCTHCNTTIHIDSAFACNTCIPKFIICQHCIHTIDHDESHDIFPYKNNPLHEETDTYLTSISTTPGNISLPPSAVKIKKTFQLHYNTDCIDEIIKSACSDETITTIDISSKAIDDIPHTLIDAIHNKCPTHITELNLSDNCITDINPAILHLKSLRILNMHKNDITVIPDGIARLSNLEILDMSCNQLVEVPFDMVYLKGLRTITLDDNQIREFPMVFYSMPQLKTISLRDNDDLQFTSRDLFKNFCNLTLHIDNSTDSVNFWQQYPNNDNNITIEWKYAYPSKIENGLYLGGLQSVIRPNILKKYGVTTIFTIGRMIEFEKMDTITYYELPIQDIPTATFDIEKIELLDTLHACILRSDVCVIHCFAGISRSSTFLIAYLMKYRRMRLDDAFRYVQSGRHKIYPNDGFWRQLCEYDRKLFQTSDRDFTHVRGNIHNVDYAFAPITI